MNTIPRACVLASVAMAACGGGGYSSNSSTTSPTTVPTGTVMITVTGQNGTQSFSPNPASAGGQMVAFRNADSIAHRVVLNDGSVDTGDIAPGATSRVVQMPSSGTNYHCALHPSMLGAVSGASTPPPACEGPYCGPGAETTDPRRLMGVPPTASPISRT